MERLMDCSVIHSNDGLIEKISDKRFIRKGMTE